jgi:hypothetical protein
LGLQAFEADTSVGQYSAVDFKTGLIIALLSTDLTAGSVENAGIRFVNAATTSPGWIEGIQFGSASGYWPFGPATSTATMIGTQPPILTESYTAGYGIDFSAVTFGTAFLKSKGFLVDGSGNETLLSALFSGSSSGTTTLKAAATASGTLTLPAATDTLADLAGAQTFTNKTIAFASNTLTGVAPLASPTFTGTVAAPTVVITANFVALSGSGTVAGGNTVAGLGMGTAGVGIYYGSGVPTISASQGSIYLRTDGSSSTTRMYINTNGTTGWINVTTPS